LSRLTFGCAAATDASRLNTTSDDATRDLMRMCVPVSLASAPYLPPRITIPGRAPVWRWLSSTTRPFTMTVGMPTGY
jgi:hypothetical protein